MPSLPFDPDRRRALALAAGAALLPAAGAVRAAPALDGPLTLVVPYAPGGATDRVARLVGERLQVHPASVRIWQSRFGRQHAPWGWGQLLGLHEVPTPEKVPPCTAHRAGVRIEQLPRVKQQAPALAGGVKLIVMAAAG